jgi:predicted nucleic acid-binding Zn ribbon protein
MPIYTFECYEEDGGCGNVFDIKCSMNEIQKQKPICPECNNVKAVSRNFCDNLYVHDGSPKTVGTLAERNASRMSNDQMQEIKTKNRIKPQFSGSLPDGAKLYDGPSNKRGKDFGRPNG